MLWIWVLLSFFTVYQFIREVLQHPSFASSTGFGSTLGYGKVWTSSAKWGTRFPNFWAVVWNVSQKSGTAVTYVAFTSYFRKEVAVNAVPCVTFWASGVCSKYLMKFWVFINLITEMSMSLSTGWLNLVSQHLCGSSAHVKKQALLLLVKKASVYVHRYLKCPGLEIVWGKIVQFVVSLEFPFGCPSTPVHFLAS